MPTQVGSVGNFQGRAKMVHLIGFIYGITEMVLTGREGIGNRDDAPLLG
jgi:hypothetical protein